jgi:hypothetical protein
MSLFRNLVVFLALPPPSLSILVVSHILVLFTVDLNAAVIVSAALCIRVLGYGFAVLGSVWC